MIAIQGDDRRPGDRRRQRVAAAQLALDMLDRVRISALDSGTLDCDLEALARSAQIERGRGDQPDGLDLLLDEIVLRARVELAKRGR